ncbi:MAG: monovalent cation/H(+) antiporter subunit G [Alphaproteobacteria bacterium]|nr:monovalent cation/H(+) antiporter subunit G [Alphaproteobacteria bacterium]
MTAALLDGLSWALLVSGGLFCMVGGIGLLRMPDFYTRCHAASVTDTLGAGLVLAGLVLQCDQVLVAAKLAIIGLLLLFIGPVATHALARAALHAGVKPLLARDGEGAPSKP